MAQAVAAAAALETAHADRARFQHKLRAMALSMRPVDAELVGAVDACISDYAQELFTGFRFDEVLSEGECGEGVPSLSCHVLAAVLEQSHAMIVDLFRVGLESFLRFELDQIQTRLEDALDRQLESTIRGALVTVFERHVQSQSNLDAALDRMLTCIEGATQFREFPVGEYVARSQGLYEVRRGEVPSGCDLIMASAANVVANDDSTRWPRSILSSTDGLPDAVPRIRVQELIDDLHNDSSQNIGDLRTRSVRIANQFVSLQGYIPSRQSQEQMVACARRVWALDPDGCAPPASAIRHEAPLDRDGIRRDPSHGIHMDVPRQNNRRAALAQLRGEIRDLIRGPIRSFLPRLANLAVRLGQYAVKGGMSGPIGIGVQLSLLAVEVSSLVREIRVALDETRDQLRESRQSNRLEITRALSEHHGFVRDGGGYVRDPNPNGGANDIASYFSDAELQFVRNTILARAECEISSIRFVRE